LQIKELLVLGDYYSTAYIASFNLLKQTAQNITDLLGIPI
jgi:hypothetical protein